MANWVDGLNKTEVGTMVVASVAGLALLGIGTDLSYSTVAEVRRCMEYHEHQSVSERKQSDRQHSLLGAPRLEIDQTAQADHDRANNNESGDPERFGCDTPDRTDEIAISYAGLWLALYAFVGTLLFSVIALLTFFVGFVESRKTP